MFSPFLIFLSRFIGFFGLVHVPVADEWDKVEDKDTRRFGQTVLSLFTMWMPSRQISAEIFSGEADMESNTPIDAERTFSETPLLDAVEYEARNQFGLNINVALRDTQRNELNNSLMFTFDDLKDHSDENDEDTKTTIIFFN